MAKVVAVCLSRQRGVQKQPMPQVELRADYGVTGDAHAGSWHRQVSLLGVESVAKVQAHVDFLLAPGAFAENILTEGICLWRLPVGTRLRLGPAVAEVTQIGKECHQDCAIRRAAGDCVMPREGIFVRILSGGVLRPGDPIEILEDVQEA